MSEQRSARREGSPASARAQLAVFALLLVLAGPGLYMVLIDVPVLRSTGALAFALLAAGTALGLLVAWRDRRRWVWVLAGLDGLASLGFTVGFFGLARLPESPSAPALVSAPDFTLPDHTGAPVTLSQALDSGPVLLVFYRGHW